MRKTTLSKYLLKTNNISTELVLIIFRAIIYPIRNASYIVNTNILYTKYIKRLYKILGLYINSIYIEITYYLDILYSRYNS